MFNISPAPAPWPNRASKAFSSDKVMFSRWLPPIGFRLSGLDPSPGINHVGAVHRAQRSAHRSSNRRLRHAALTQQYHLDALALRRRDFPAQRGFQFPDLTLGAFDHLFPQNQMIIKIHTAPHARQQPATATPRFNQLWNRYEKPLVFWPPLFGRSLLLPFSN